MPRTTRPWTAWPPSGSSPRPSCPATRSPRSPPELPEQRHFVRPEGLVARDHAGTLDGRLSDQQPIERIAMVWRQPFDGGGVLEADRQRQCPRPDERLGQFYRRG